MANLHQAQFPPNLASIYNEEITNQLANTQGALSSLNQLKRLLLNPVLLMRPIIAKEAEASSQLEGTQASVEDAYQLDLIKQSPEKRSEALEIRNYEEAMLTGYSIISKYKLNTFTLREIHRELTKGVRGKEKHPGEFRKGEVWIGTEGTSKGDARYVPPEALHIEELMNKLEAFIENSGTIHPLIACAVIHHRFEAIHPFEDGNGRTGRLLISLFLIKQGLLDLPILYVSGHFEKNKQKYMDALSSVDKNEDWYSWILFFLRSLEIQAKISYDVGIKIDDLFKKSRVKIEHERAGLNLIRVLEHTFVQPYITTPIIHKSLGIPTSSIQRYLNILMKKEILVDMGIHEKERVFLNKDLISILRSI